jgi:hypothetical protein
LPSDTWPKGSLPNELDSGDDAGLRSVPVPKKSSAYLAWAAGLFALVVSVSSQVVFFASSSANPLSQFPQVIYAYLAVGALGLTTFVYGLWIFDQRQKALATVRLAIQDLRISGYVKDSKGGVSQQHIIEQRRLLIASGDVAEAGQLTEILKAGSTSHQVG